MAARMYCCKKSKGVGFRLRSPSSTTVFFKLDLGKLIGVSYCIPLALESVSIELVQVVTWWDNNGCVILGLTTPCTMQLCL